ncbi:hypothetical protein [Aliamphritea spongicola]|nr:hypothetical protein [Aliamphritea spongicola]
MATPETGSTLDGPGKNRCKNGDHYWVRAFVTPIYDKHGTKIGYQSVRTRPSEEEKQLATRLYKRLNNDSRVSFTRQSLMVKIGATLLAGIAVAGSVSFMPLDTTGKLFVLTATTGAVGYTAFRLLSPLQKLLNNSREVYDNPVAQLAMTGRMDETGAVEVAMRMQKHSCVPLPDGLKMPSAHWTASCIPPGML